MMVSNRDVARAFANKTSASGSNFFTDGEVIYSYGKHWPVAIHTRSGVMLNESKTSVTTSKHTTYVRDAVVNYEEVSHTEIAELVSTAVSATPVVLLRQVKPSTENEFNECVEAYCKSNNLSKRQANMLSKRWLNELKRLKILSEV